MGDEKKIPNLDSQAFSKKVSSLVADLFGALNKDGQTVKFFHPFVLTSDMADTLCEYAGKDIYLIFTQCDKEDRVVPVGLGMLRGWDQGYKVPSLGMAVHPSHRGDGIGKQILLKLHEVAEARGVERIRLKVYSENAAAVSLYRSSGYTFDEEEEGQLVGYHVL